MVECKCEIPLKDICCHGNNFKWGLILEWGICQSPIDQMTIPGCLQSLSRLNCPNRTIFGEIRAISDSTKRSKIAPTSFTVLLDVCTASLWWWMTWRQATKSGSSKSLGLQCDTLFYLILYNTSLTLILGSGVFFDPGEKLRSTILKQVSILSNSFHLELEGVQLFRTRVPP